MSWDGISSIPDESYTTVTRSSLPRLWEQGIPWKGEDDCWVGEAMVLHITTPCTWMCETGTGQQVAQLVDSYMMMMINHECTLNKKMY
jgi:hypothetical protein